MSLISSTEAKSFLKITGADEDALINQIVNAVDARVKEFLNYNVESSDYTQELINGNGTEYLIPKYFPITDVSVIEVYDGLDSSNAEVWDEWTQGSDYDRRVIMPSGDKIYLGGACFPLGVQNVRLTYMAGYTTIPKDIVFSCLQLVQLYYMGVRGEAILGKSSISRPMGQGVTTTYDLNAETSILDKIVHYKLYNV